jgi:hypothetical protein
MEQSKQNNSKSRCRKFSADDAVVEMSNRFSVLERDTVNTDQHTGFTWSKGRR